ncbi:MAG: hypothetical protein KC503_29035 [Myxococcales bacterium]|nr:hypothetical protein [Myxococcales bacterium]
MQRWMLCLSLLLCSCPAGLPPSSRPDTTGGGDDLTFQYDVYVPSSTPDTSWLPVDGNPPQFDGPAAPGDGGAGDADGDAQVAAGDGTRDAGPAGDSTVDTQPPDTTVDQPPVLGAWVQANSQNCPNFCAGLGKVNVAAPDGPHCMSGERRPASGIAAGITFAYGCWPNCTAQGAFAATSSGQYCYSAGQKKDNDGTDRTVGCYCQ